jgi:hypothetical protein
MKFACLFLLSAGLALSLAAPLPRSNHDAGGPAVPGTQSLADSMQRKLDYLEANGRKSHPDPKPTIITDAEANAYVAAGRVQLPQGVKSVKFSGTPGVITGNSRVDFDQLTASQRSSNPMLQIFSGVHDVQVVAHANAAQGQGHVQVDSVSLDGTEIPRFVLQLFVSHYLESRYPGVGLDSTFRLASRVDSARVGNHDVTLIQK